MLWSWAPAAGWLQPPASPRHDLVIQRLREMPLSGLLQDLNNQAERPCVLGCISCPEREGMKSGSVFLRESRIVRLSRETGWSGAGLTTPKRGLFKQDPPLGLPPPPGGWFLVGRVVLLHAATGRQCCVTFSSRCSGDQTPFPPCSRHLNRYHLI